MNKELLVQNGIDVDKSLEFWGDLEGYEESLREFYNELGDKIKTLEFYMNSNDTENYGILAHSIKSECKYLGMMSQAEVFFDHEKAGKDNNINYIYEHFDEIQNVRANIVDLLSKAFGENVNNSSKTILIADDSNIILNFIEKNIGEFNILRANNGEEAINYIMNNDLYAILLDLNMPIKNGFEVLDYLKSNNLIDKIPVVIITGDDTNETINKAFNYPILDVLNKPFNENNINRVLGSIKSFYEDK